MSLNVKMIQESFEKAKPIADQVATKFYEFLFADYPQAKPLFEKVDIEKQKKALVGSLVFIVSNLENGNKLKEYLQNMGGRHVKYGVQNDQYKWVGGSLLKTFKHFFGDEWTPELEAEWTKAYGVIAQYMIEGAEKAKPNIENIKSKAVAVCNTLLLETLDKEINPEFKDEVRTRVRAVLMKVLEEEADKLFHKKAS